MTATVRNKISHLKSLSKRDAVPGTFSASTYRTVNDSLTKSLRTKKDVDIFRNELNTAFQLAKK